MYNSVQKLKFVFIAFLLVILFVPTIIFAGVGVGVGAGKIIIKEPLKQGGVYELPALPVLNTGDEASEYGLSIDYDRNQTQLKPPKEWFDFEPSLFNIEPGKVQMVNMKLTVPVKTVPGYYFAYVEAHPIKKAVAGQTGVGIAAAAKLYFTIEPSNIWQGIYYRFISLYSRYHPLDTIILAIISAVILIYLFRKNFKIQIAKR